MERRTALLLLAVSAAGSLQHGAIGHRTCRCGGLVCSEPSLESQFLDEARKREEAARARPDGGAEAQKRPEGSGSTDIREIVVDVPGSPRAVPRRPVPTPRVEDQLAERIPPAPYLALGGAFALGSALLFFLIAAADAGA